ncbi:hypothetical protein OV079_10605 [Nannocystis pusilla]|uniref:Uncharacterized protein n=1 Tax=Nannocystis pusilla TaxID=889268 RepID=A0A9X3ET31_9BACT|nr:hypothetical protein [Nannocystis pusilla]MCY1006006.1 hypothetical protein [Nannocystis pusilla]
MMEVAEIDASARSVVTCPNGHDGSRRGRRLARGLDLTERTFCAPLVDDLTERTWR